MKAKRSLFLFSEPGLWARSNIWFLVSVSSFQKGNFDSKFTIFGGLVVSQVQMEICQVQVENCQVIESSFKRTSEMSSELHETPSE